VPQLQLQIANATLNYATQPKLESKQMIIEFQAKMIQTHYQKHEEYRY